MGTSVGNPWGGGGATGGGSNAAVEARLGNHHLVSPALSQGIVPSGRYDLYLGYFRLNNPEKPVPSGRLFLPLVPQLWQRDGRSSFKYSQ
jgi:hypothetical protein